MRCRLGAKPGLRQVVKRVGAFAGWDGPGSAVGLAVVLNRYFVLVVRIWRFVGGSPCSDPMVTGRPARFETPLSDSNGICLWRPR